MIRIFDWLASQFRAVLNGLIENQTVIKFLKFKNF